MRHKSRKKAPTCLSNDTSELLDEEYLPIEDEQENVNSGSEDTLVILDILVDKLKVDLNKILSTHMSLDTFKIKKQALLNAMKTGSVGCGSDGDALTKEIVIGE